MFSADFTTAHRVSGICFAICAQISDARIAPTAGIIRTGGFMKIFNALGICLLLAAATTGVRAAEWSDTWIGDRYGSRFREPANGAPISKNILQLQHASSYSLGSNFLNIDLLQSDAGDPAKGGGGARETFVVYRNTLSASRLTGRNLGSGKMLDFGVVMGFDWNKKNDAFASNVRRPMLGASVSFDVPGFWNLALLRQAERNYNGITGRAVTFDNAWRIETAWETPFEFAGQSVKFQGFMNHVAPKGRDGFGIQTRAETLLETSIMFDIGRPYAKGVLFAGIGYQYWQNKFGSDSALDPSGGSCARTPQLQMEWHL